MYNLFANVRVASAYIDVVMVKKIVTSFIKPTLEYAAVLWNSHLKEHVENIEKEQKKTTRCVPSLRECVDEE